MTAPAFINLGPLAFHSNTSHAALGGIPLQYPTNVVLGQRLVAAVFGDDLASGAMSWGSAGGEGADWPLIGRVNDGGQRTLAVFSKLADQGDVDNSAINGFNIFTPVSSTNGLGKEIGQIAAYAPSGAVEAAGTNSGTGTAVAPSSITTSANEELAVMIAAYETTSDIQAITGNTGGTWSESQSQTSLGYTLSFQQAAMPTAGTISGGSATISSALFWQNVTFAIQGVRIVTTDLLAAIDNISGVVDRPIPVTS